MGSFSRTLIAGSWPPSSRVPDRLSWPSLDGSIDPTEEASEHVARRQFVPCRGAARPAASGPLIFGTGSIVLAGQLLHRPI